MSEENRFDALAKDVLLLARNTLLVDMRFLDSALSRFLLVPEGTGSLATDGEHIFYDTLWVLRRYKREKESIVRDYLHMVFHCVFSHAFSEKPLNRACWDLACDIAVESVITDLGLESVRCTREASQAATIAALRRDLNLLTAEKIYRYYMDKQLSPRELENLRRPFLADDHSRWKMPSEDGSNETSGESEEYIPDDEDLEDMWEEIAQQMQTDLETFSRDRENADAMLQNLRAVTRERYNYAAFLKRFAVMGEVTQTDDTEFDYIYYTYGMQIYGRMPLIEPLEYKEVRRIKEFVIAIDTSGSVSGDLVQSFVTKTYNILMQQESFFSRINLHIIQCDEKIQEDKKITCQKEFDEYLENMTLRGFGGTDFRPVFEYVEELRKKREFENLKGLIYFTDGEGIFPEKKPDYNTAFVFVDNGNELPPVPVWGIRLALDPDEILDRA